MANLQAMAEAPALPQPGQMPSVNISTKPSILFGIFIILVVLGGFGAWAALAELSSAVVASGVVTVDSNRKTVQHLEGGIVAKILVSDGDEVKQDQLLIRLDDTRAAANLANIEAQIDVFEARLARLKAEQGFQKKITFSDAFKARSYEPVVADMIAAQTSLFEARSDRLEGEIILQAQKKIQYQQQIEGLEAQIDSIREIKKISSDELATSRRLYENGNLPLSPILEKEKELANLKGRLGGFQSDIAIAKASMVESDLERIQLKINFRETVESELLETQARTFELREQHNTANYEHHRIDIRAPRAGKVLSLSVHTEGGVISPGQAILDIVPNEDELIVEARIQPQDIDKVTLDQVAVVRMSAFSARTTPELNGLVKGISADSFLDETNGMSFYKLRIHIPLNELEKLNELVLLPGMPAEVFVQIEERTLISYLMKPLYDSALRAFRED